MSLASVHAFRSFRAFRAAAAHAYAGSARRIVAACSTIIASMPSRTGTTRIGTTLCGAGGGD